jgi:rhodanese-related sulfurtransferase
MQNFTVFIASHMALFYGFAAVLIALMIVEFLRAKRGQVRIGPKEAVVMINKQNAVVVDVRSSDHYRNGHIVGAINAPLTDWPAAIKKLDKYKKKPVIVVCSNGADAHKAAANLSKQGYNAFAMTGGTRAWTGAELPLVKE